MPNFLNFVFVIYAFASETRLISTTPIDRFVLNVCCATLNDPHDNFSLCYCTYHNYLEVICVRWWTKVSAALRERVPKNFSATYFQLDIFTNFPIKNHFMFKMQI